MRDHARRGLSAMPVRTGARVGRGAQLPIRRPAALDAGDRIRNDHCNDQPVDSQHARHHHRHDALHDELRLAYAEGGDAHAALPRAVCRTKIGEDEGKGGAHEAKERRVDVIIGQLLCSQRPGVHVPPESQTRS